mmetsp:Transcript_13245/g.24325  ORF Transcript_13245/g.24325 Transcript_13245/m.24325 type:complete len:294 (+) Transcript_13245:11289-12170(+)
MEGRELRQRADHAHHDSRSRPKQGAGGVRDAGGWQGQVQGAGHGRRPAGDRHGALEELCEVRRLALPEELALGGGLAGELGEGAERVGVPPRLQALADDRAAQKVPSHSAPDESEDYLRGSSRNQEEHGADLRRVGRRLHFRRRREEEPVALLTCLRSRRRAGEAQLHSPGLDQDVRVQYGGSTRRNLCVGRWRRRRRLGDHSRPDDGLYLRRKGGQPFRPEGAEVLLGQVLQRQVDRGKGADNEGSVRAQQQRRRGLPRQHQQDSGDRLSRDLQSASEHREECPEGQKRHRH